MTTAFKTALCAAGLFALSGTAMADTVQFSGSIDGSEPTFDNPATGATTITGYDVTEFSVDADGSYDFLSFYAGDAAADENMDGYLVLYEGSFDPLGTTFFANDDDYTAGEIAGLAAFDGACVGQNCSGFSADLMAGTSYFLVQTSFTDAATSFGQPTGPYDSTITGPGTITVAGAVPVPAAVWLFMSGILGLGAMRRRG